MVNNDIYYQVGEEKTLSKIKALDLANGAVDKIRYCFQEKIYDAVDWTKEPSTSWQDMLDAQCRKLKQQHEYLILWYSGGWDSQTILDNFIKLNIPLDEIVIYRKEYSPEGLEVAAAIEYANKVKAEIFPNMKVTVFNMTAQHHIPYYTDKDWSWVYHPGWFPNFSKTHRERFISGDYGLHKDLNLDYVAMQGYEKPFLVLEDNKWYFLYPDQMTHWIINSPGYSFFCPQDNAEILVKQAWMAVKWFESLPSKDIKNLSYNIQLSINYRDIKGMYAAWNKACGRTSTVDNIPTPMGKVMFRPNDNFSALPYAVPNESLGILKDIVGSKEFETYKQGLDYAMKYSTSEDKIQLPIINSKKYYIKDLSM